jgi:hypothetical protein
MARRSTSWVSGAGSPSPRKQECEEVHDWVAIMPLEVGMRHFAGSLFEIDHQQCCECIGDHRTFRTQNAVLAEALAVENGRKLNMFQRKEGRCDDW